MNTICSVKGITKKFGNTIALKNIDLTINKGEILGIIGENGAGKSTLLKVLTGIQQPNAGSITFHGKEIKPKNYFEAVLLGITMVFQEQALVPNLKVYENLLLSQEKRFEKYGILRQKQMIKYAKEILEFMELDDINPENNINYYDFSTRQMIEIAKAISIPRILGINGPLILFDEPTTSLSYKEVEKLYEKMKKIQSFASMIFISHRLNEVKQFCDRLYVFKDGENVTELSPDTSEESIHELMVGRKRDKQFYKEYLQNDDYSNEVILKVENLSRGGSYKNVNFTLRKGEILGVGGVLGCGKNTLGRTIAGITKQDKGEIFFENRLLNFKHIKNAINEGIGFIPAERHSDGIILYMPISWNITLTAIEKIMDKFLPFLNLTKENNIVRNCFKSLRIKSPGIKVYPAQLSGGNQQKVVIAKWLIADLKILILDNPTRGIDVGAKEEIYELIRNLAIEKQLSIILITDDLLELIGLSNKIIIMKNGEITNTIDSLSNNKPSEEELVKYMV